LKRIVYKMIPASLPVDKETFNPVLKKSLNGFLSYVRNSALFDKGDMASPTCLR
jgi:hypothetical protein